VSQKKYLFIRCVLSVSFVLGGGPAAHAQSRGQPPATPVSGAVEATVLGPQHAALAALLGNWNVQIVLGDGAAPAQHSTGKAEYAWVVKGRWLSCRITGSIFGEPYEQFTIVGYDSYAKNIVEVSVESVDNSMLMARGPFANPNQSVTSLFGELDEYSSGVLHQPYKVVWNRLSADRHITTIVGFDDAGKEVRKLQLTFSRTP
jgi:uncharacterized protein DUF1579